MKRTAALAFLLLLAGAARASQRVEPSAPELPVIRISLDLIQVDAVVTDAKGRHVTDLGPADFTLEEGGQRQKVTNVAYVRVGAPASGGRTGGEVGNPAVQGAQSPLVGRTLVFVVDDLGMSFASMTSARKALLRFAEEPLASGDHVALLRTGQSERSFRLTSNRAAFAKDVAALRFNMWSPKGASSQLPAPSSGHVPQPGSLTQELFRRRLAFLLGTVDGLRRLPGRKALLLLSEGFSFDQHKRYGEMGIDSPFESVYDDSDAHSALRTLIDMANRAAVVAYAIDPRGLEYDMPTAADGIEGRGGPPSATMDLVRARYAERVKSQGSLRDLAEQTGGLAVVNRNDLVGGLAEILNDQRGYYLIGYEPSAATFEKDSDKPRFHEIKVRVTRPGLKVRSRTGFYGLTDEEVARRVAVPKSN